MIRSGNMFFSAACILPIGFLLVRYYISLFKWRRCRSSTSMYRKTVVITGANSGLGKKTASEMAKRGARVICACRNLEAGKAAINDIRKTVRSGELILIHLDLGSFTSIHCFVDDILRSEPKIDILINNAGVFGCPYSLTSDGFETQIGVNHLGHFLLTKLLLPKLKESSSRIIVVASSLYKYGKIDLEFIENPDSVSYNKQKGYSNSKLANIMFSQELIRQLNDADVNVFPVCPGMVWTNLGRHIKIDWWKMILFAPFAFFFVRSTYEGCQTILHCCTEEKVKQKLGYVFMNCNKIPLKDNALDLETQNRLWNLSLKLTELKD